MAHGAQEIDVVAPLAPLLARRVAAVASDLRAVVEAARQQVPGSVVKVIVETAMLAASGEKGLLEAACEVEPLAFSV